MKIRSVEIFGDNFRSLPSHTRYEFNNSNEEDRLSTKIFAGLNGSGKSNFLELFSEIFYYLEIFHMRSASDEDKIGKNFGFSIEYILPLADDSPLKAETPDASQLEVSIIKKLNEFPEFSYSIPEFDISRRVDYMGPNGLSSQLLPNKIIAYSSGQNELLSNPFYKIKYHYHKSLSDYRIRDEDKDLLKRNKLFFLNYESNFSIFVANMLLAQEPNLGYYKKILKLKDLHSFRVSLNFVDYRRKKIKIRPQLLDKIEWLKKCASCYYEEKDKEGFVKSLILDFKVGSEMKSAFDFYFESAFGLFKLFYELDLLNINLVKSRTRDTIISAHKGLNLSDEIPKADPSKLVFRIEKIIVEKKINKEETKNIYYKALSDGEHQFSQVIGSILMIEEPGCLFLLDEPNTHFNPKWRAKMIKFLNQITGIEFDSQKRVTKVRPQEIIITTHSPFIISDSRKEDVYKFTNGKFVNPENQTYGSSIEYLLELIFDRDISISNFSNDQLIRLKESIQTRRDIEQVKNKLLEFGESIEKFDAYSFLLKKEKEFTKNDI
ncbi:restriction system-associated AAA family ATPase [Salinimicrobium sp. TIG7-5_MAKvit]|uniref:restriction system-associated AAA family ATPase n=1 Tax=Salinimicrobium sp. TIG7-5_MAKvit TaxID=3121289 RepID=UPI003C6E49ED